MGIAVAFVLSTLLAQGESPSPAAGPQEAPVARPILPGESGHVLKMTREIIALARTHDSERRMDLFLRQAEERLREREALEKIAPEPERDRLGRVLGQSYAKLVGTGAAGAIECGAAEGRDMTAAGARYVNATRGHRQGWSKVAGAAGPEERTHYREALLISEKAAERVREAQEAGRVFLAQERAKEEARSREKSPDRDRKDRERKDPEADRPRRNERDDPQPPEHHPTHPHRPHR